MPISKSILKEGANFSFPGHTEYLADICDNKKIIEDINTFWDNKITPTLVDYIKIPNKSPSFDRNWKENGHMDKVLQVAKKWTEEHLQKMQN